MTVSFSYSQELSNELMNYVYNSELYKKK